MRPLFIVPAMALFAMTGMSPSALLSLAQLKIRRRPHLSLNREFRDRRQPRHPWRGKNSFTEAEAKKRLRSFGYTGVSAIHQDAQSIWRGTATKNGKSGPVARTIKATSSPNNSLCSVAEGVNRWPHDQLREYSTASKMPRKRFAILKPRVSRLEISALSPITSTAPQKSMWRQPMPAQAPGRALPLAVLRIVAAGVCSPAEVCSRSPAWAPWWRPVGSLQTAVGVPSRAALRALIWRDHGHLRGGGYRRERCRFLCPKRSAAGGTVVTAKPRR